MIKDSASFFGRKRELASIYARLQGSELQCCSIVGSRRIGKSSLLFHLSRPEVYRHYLGDRAERYMFVLLDPLELPSPTAERLFQALLERLEAIGGDRLRVDPQRDADYDGMLRFITRCADEGWRFVFCLDEFERLAANPHLDSDFFGYLRSLTKYQVTYVTASKSSLERLCHRGRIDTSLFWNIFSQMDLGLMTDEEAHELITVPFERAGISLSEEERGRVLRLAGPHPFFIQVACFELFELKRSGSRLTEEDYRKWEEGFHSEARPHFEYAWDQLSGEDRKALQDLTVEGRVPAGWRLRGLKSKALIVQKEGGPRPFSQAFEDFILSNVPTAIGEETGLGPVESLTVNVEERYIEYRGRRLRFDERNRREFKLLVFLLERSYAEGAPDYLPHVRLYEVIWQDLLDQEAEQGLILSPDQLRKRSYNALKRIKSNLLRLLKEELGYEGELLLSRKRGYEKEYAACYDPKRIVLIKPKEDPLSLAEKILKECYDETGDQKRAIDALRRCFSEGLVGDEVIRILEDIRFEPAVSQGDSEALKQLRSIASLQLARCYLMLERAQEAYEYLIEVEQAQLTGPDERALVSELAHKLGAYFEGIGKAEQAKRCRQLADRQS